MFELQITKSNSLVEASYNLPVQAQKLILACLSKLNSRHEIPKEITLHASEFSDMMGINKSNAHRELYKAADVLFRASIVIKDGATEREICWVQEKVKTVKGEGKVTLIWSDSVIKYISCLKNRFTTYKLRYISNLQSTSSIRLYELLMRFSSTRERVINLSDFKFSLGIQDKYPQFKILNRDIIKPAVAELNKCTDLEIKYETLKIGRSVVALSFEFNYKSS